MKNKTILFKIIGFSLILIFPHFFLLTDKDIQADENKEKVEFPKFNFPHIGRFRVDFDKYYKENFSGKNFFVTTFNYFQYFILKSSPLPKSVIIGKSGWLFLGNSYSDVIYEHLGLSQFFKNELDTIWGNIENRNEWCKQQDIKYYICIAPNKHTIYEEFLPLYYKNQNKTKLEQLKEYLKEKQFELIDLKDYFYKFDTLQLFHKTNTHWNDIGAFLGYKRLINSIQKDFNDLEEFDLSDFKIDTVIKYREDLTEMIKINIKEEHIKLTPKTQYQAIELEKKLVVPENYFRASDNYEYRYKGIGKLKVLVFRDSFSTSMIQFLKEYFGESIYIWHHDFNKEIIEQEKPDIVITEIIERDIDVLIKK